MAEQKTLIRAIFNDEQAHSFEERGLIIYQKNLMANATKALIITFPTVLKLVGDDVFSYAVAQLIKQDPPNAGDWGLWGKCFSIVLKQLPALQAFPYVADIATLEFSLHQLARAKDSEFDRSSISLLAACELDELRLVLNPALQLFASEFPIVDIYQANQSLPKQTEYYLQQAQQKLVSGLGQVGLLHRPQFKSLVRTIEPNEYDWLVLMQKDFSIGEALEILQYRKQQFSLEAWLPLAIEQNLISHLEKI